MERDLQVASTCAWRKALNMRRSSGSWPVKRRERRAPMGMVLTLALIPGQGEGGRWNDCPKFKDFAVSVIVE
jgi:hypothetical protein